MVCAVCKQGVVDVMGASKRGKTGEGDSKASQLLEKADHPADNPSWSLSRHPRLSSNLENAFEFRFDLDLLVSTPKLEQ